MNVGQSPNPILVEDAFRRLAVCYKIGGYEGLAAAILVVAELDLLLLRYSPEDYCHHLWNDAHRIPYDSRKILQIRENVKKDLDTFFASKYCALYCSITGIDIDAYLAKCYMS